MKQTPDIHNLIIYTIGHGNRTKDCFLQLLNQYNIKLLIDVRTFPYSRYNPQFRRKQLEADLNSVGIKYLFIGEALGGRPNRPELYKNDKLDYAAVKQTTLFKSGIAKVTDLLKKKIKVTLMCSESNPNDCHRKHLLANEFIKEGLIIWHINKAGKLEKHQDSSTPCLFD